MKWSAVIRTGRAAASSVFLATAFVVLAATVVTARGTAAPASSSAPESVAGTLRLQAGLRLVSELGACPPGVSATCATRRGDGIVRGLGRVTETYAWLADIGPPSCAAGFGTTRSYEVRLVVAAKGEIHFVLSEGSQCVQQEAVRTQAQDFAITAGTGIYAGATGGGTVDRILGGETATGRVGRETWTGTLDVPGLEFDVKPPALSGAASKSVRAPRRARTTRVRFTVTARDDSDGDLTVACSPRSGSRFPLGRTRVTCSATDASGNTATARFTVTVRARR